MYAAYKERTSHIIGNVRCPILDKPSTPLLFDQYLVISQKTVQDMDIVTMER